MCDRIGSQRVSSSSAARAVALPCRGVLPDPITLTLGATRLDLSRARESRAQERFSYSPSFNAAPISPTMPRRKAITQIMKIAP